MTQSFERGGPPAGRDPDAGDRPKRRRSVSVSLVKELGGSAVAGVAVVWLAFYVSGTSISSGALGFGVCCIGAFFTVYAMLCLSLHGILVMKDRLATVAIWAGALVAFIPLVWVIGYVIVQGGSVVVAHFPHFFYADFTGYTATAPVTAVGAGAAIVGTIEQVGLATIFSVPLGVLTATYLVNSRTAFATVVSNVVDAMSGAPAIIMGLFIYILWVLPQKEIGQTGFAASMALAVMMLPIVTRTAQEVISIVPGSLTEAALALGSPRWRSILRVTLPTARVGLVTAVILGVARIAGETAPILFDTGGNPAYNFNPFSGKQDDLPFRVYQQILQPGVDSTREAWGVALRSSARRPDPVSVGPSNRLEESRGRSRMMTRFRNLRRSPELEP